VLISSDSSRSVWSTGQDAGDWKEWRLSARGEEVAAFEDLAAKSETGVSPLGSGSDYTAFLQRYGVSRATTQAMDSSSRQVASANFGYGGGPKDPVYHYHSIYDSFTWQEK
jgi:N-acetylated-alpha-linked acidic dipeptidase